MTASAVMELRNALAHLGAVIDATRIRLQREIKENDLQRTPYEMCDDGGTPILAPLLAAQVNGLAALVTLKYAEPRAVARPPGGSRG